MPKKAKKAGGKTEEERLVQQQQRAQAEEEMAKKKEETLTLFLKDKLQKEERNTTVNRMKLDESWRTKLRQTRAAELQEEAVVMKRTMERRQDEMYVIKQRLDRNLQEAELQEEDAQRSHLKQVEQLVEQYNRQLELLQEQWEESQEELDATLSNDRQLMLNQCEQQKLKLQELKTSAEQQHRDWMKKMLKLHRGHLLHDTGDNNKKTASPGENQKLDLDSQQDDIWKTPDLDQNLAMIQDISRNEEKTRKKLEEDIRRLRTELKLYKDRESLIGSYQEATDTEIPNLHELRKAMSRHHTEARKQLTEFSVQDENTAARLQDDFSESEKLLLAAEICCKEENVSLSSWSFSSRLMEDQRNTAAEEFGELVDLQQLMQRLNGALLQREVLTKHGDVLGRQNEQIEALLFQLDDAVNGCYSLLVVSEAPTTTVPLTTRRRHTVIEAVHAVRHSL